MDHMDLSQLSPVKLLALHAQIADQLRARGITRSSNNPTGDLAEFLFCKAFGWKQTDKSYAHIDAIGTDGLRYQIKGRKITRHNASRQLGALREPGGAHFDFLAGVLFAKVFCFSSSNHSAQYRHRASQIRGKYKQSSILTPR